MYLEHRWKNINNRSETWQTGNENQSITTMKWLIAEFKSLGSVGMKKRQRNPSLIIYVDQNRYGPVLWIQILYIEFGSWSRILAQFGFWARSSNLCTSKSFAYILSYNYMCASGSVFGICIRIQKAPEYGSNKDSDPQQWCGPRFINKKFTFSM